MNCYAYSVIYYDLLVLYCVNVNKCNVLKNRSHILLEINVQASILPFDFKPGGIDLQKD